MDETRIVSVWGREVLDSRGNPTVEAEVELACGAVGRAIVPSGASTGRREALELRDGDPERFGGKGVRRAVEHVRDRIAEQLVGLDAADQGQIDRAMLELDGTAEKKELGANAILAVSMASARAAAEASGVPLWFHLGGLRGGTLPVPLMNVLNGGAHADNGLDIQEFMLVPHGFERFSEALRAGVETFHVLRGLLREQGLSTAVGDEGGFAPRLPSNERALELLLQAVEQAGFRPAEQISLALDCAASEFFDAESGTYRFEGEAQPAEAMVERYAHYATRFPVVSIEDGLAEDDWEGWQALTERLGERLQLVGDDLFVTQERELRKGIELGAANAVLVKLNQVGRVTETLGNMEVGARHGYRSVVSHRSGETEDVFIAHLAVGTACGQIKTGSASRTDRLAKYNELLRVEEALGASARFEGSAMLPGRG